MCVTICLCRWALLTLLSSILYKWPVYCFSLVKAYWTFPPIHGQKCLNEGDVAFYVGIFHCLTDLLITVIPMHFIIRLNLPLHLWLGVLILLCLGFIVTAAGIVRVYFSYAIIAHFDETWISYPLWIAAAIEVNIGLVRISFLEIRGCPALAYSDDVGKCQ